MLINASYIIAIPTYNRYKELNNKTLNLLHNYEIDKNQIYIFGANEEEEVIYKNNINPEYYHKIIVGELGIRNQRKFISKYFPEGQRIVSMDDDIEKILEFVKTNHWTELKPVYDLNNLINYFFSYCIKENIYLWGVYPVNNVRWLSEKIRTDLRFIIGVFHGYINRHDEDLYPDIKCIVKEDIEQSILFYKKDLKILRFEKYSFKTKFNAVGGLGQDRFEGNKLAQDYLCETYPDICKRKFRKNGMPEIRLVQPK